MRRRPPVSRARAGVPAESGPARSGPDPSTRRVFLALPLPPPARRELAARCAPLLAAADALRPVAPAGYHVTVHFFGNLSGGDLARACELCRRDALRDMVPLRCRLTGLAQLPPHGPARVLHAVFGGGAGALADFLARMRGLAAGAGFPVDRRPPRPHVTVARVRRARTWTARAPVTWSGAWFLLDRLVLFESHLDRAGARYEALAVRPLGAS